MLSKKRKKEWVDALRSGEYKQGRGTLCKENKDGSFEFCCLGVLYDATQDAWWIKDTGRYSNRSWKAKDGKLYRIGIFGTNLLRVSDIHKLVAMNDTGWSFKRIANWIEKNL